MSKLSKVAAIAAVLPVLAFSAPAFAVTVSQIERGDIYRVADITTNPNPTGHFADSITAACGDTVEFRVRIHNVGPDTATNVKVAATLDGTSNTSHSSQITLSADNDSHGPVTAAAGLTTSKATTISYVNGSTELLDVNGNKLSTLADGVTSAAGLNIGNVGGLTSDTREVQFQAKLNCTPPQTCVPPQTGTFPNCTTPTPPKQLVNTGAGDVAGLFAGVAILGALGHRLFLGRKLSRNS